MQPARLIVFPSNMGTPAPIPTPQNQTERRWDPHRYGNLAQWIAALVACAIGIYSIHLTTNYHNAESDQKSSDDRTNGLITKQFSPLDSRLSRLEGRMDQLSLDLNRLSKLQVEKLSGQIQAFRKSNVKLDSAVLLRLDESLNQIAANSPAEVSQAAWKVKNDLLSYKSFLNAKTAPNIPTQKFQPPPGDFWVFNIQGRKIPGTDGYYHIGASPVNAPASDAARYEPLDQAPNENHSVGTSHIVFFGDNQTELHIDGFWIKNAVIRDSDIYYIGGPVRLENVTFVNCRFFIQNSHPESLQLAENILSSSAVNFRTPS
jgi:hypothetical protein